MFHTGNQPGETINTSEQKRASCPDLHRMLSGLLSAEGKSSAGIKVIQDQQFSFPGSSGENLQYSALPTYKSIRSYDMMKGNTERSSRSISVYPMRYYHEAEHKIQYPYHSTDLCYAWFSRNNERPARSVPVSSLFLFLP